MARESLGFAHQSKPLEPWSAPKIHLTMAQAEAGEMVIEVSLTECIAYSTNVGFTRLNLTGGKILDVRETTDQIDRLVRQASSEINSSVVLPPIEFPAVSKTVSGPAGK